MNRLARIMTQTAFAVVITAMMSVAASAQLLNEIEVDPPVDVGDRCQYVEILGTPNAAVPPNTYFISINSDSSNFGFLNVAVDISGQTYGANGTITLVNTLGGTCPNRTYDAGTNVVNYSSLTSLGQTSEGFYVVRSTSTLSSGQDLDTNDNGIVDQNESSLGIPLLYLDGINFIFNPDEQFAYGPGPNLVETLLGDVPDAATRFPNNTLANNGAAWYSGELADTPEETTSYGSPVSSNFPAGGMLTPGATNVPDTMPASDSLNQSMLRGNAGFKYKPVFTVGQTLSSTGAYNPNQGSSYTPPGILDGLGAYELNADTVRIFANHELLNFDGYSYQVSNGSGGTFSMTGARVSYFDIDKKSMQVVDSGVAYNTIYDANGNVATDTSFLANNLAGFSRFCSANFFPADQFGSGSGLENAMFITGEEDGGNFNPVGGANWALDPATGNLWHIPDFGRGAWESTTSVDTGDPNTVAFLLADDSSPFNANPDDSENEAAPAYLYVGTKNPAGDFLAQNGLRGGTLYVWVSNTGETRPSQFNTSGTLNGSWVEIDNTPNGTPSEDGATGFDEFGYPTQRTLWTRAETLGSFGFSRPEDVATNPEDGTEVVFASTGVDTYDVLPSGDGADTFGTMYTFKTTFGPSVGASIPATMTIIYDGDADPQRRLRSPDNLDWADDGFIYVQEDEAEFDTLGTGEILFGPGAVNPNEAGIVRLDENGFVDRIANIDRNVVLDASLPNPEDAVDDSPVAGNPSNVGRWESSGILDVSKEFGRAPGTLFVMDVQAHGIDDQERFNANSRIQDADLKEGGQLLLAIKPRNTADFDGDGRTDLSVYRSSEGNWYVNNSNGSGFSIIQWGLPTDTIVPGDYDGDGQTDRAIFRPDAGGGALDYWVLNSNNGAFSFGGFSWGNPGDIPVEGDFDGDGLCDPAVYRPSTNQWFILNTSNGVASITTFGNPGDIPLAGDFDNDGKADITTFNAGTFTSMLSGGGMESVTVGSSEALGANVYAVAADYDGDGETDQATFADGTWTIVQSSDDETVVVNFGASGDRPVAADYDGDGRVDVAIYRDGDWWIQNSAGGSITPVTVANFGLSIDTPVPGAYYPLVSVDD